MSKHVTAIGVDGCPAGWFFVRCRRGVFDFGVTATLATLLDKDIPTRLAVDIPIGLREQRALMRACDRDARRLLAAKRSSVFTPPLRGALMHDDHPSASAWQKRRCGKGLSIQAFNIAKKIAQVDTLLQTSSVARKTVFEAHPELCFFGLNDGQPVLESKKTIAGANLRMALLDGVMPEASPLLEKALGSHRRKDVARDDIIDALVTLYVARLSPDQTLSVPLIPEHDARGLPMRITLAAPTSLRARIETTLDGTFPTSATAP